MAWLRQIAAVSPVDVALTQPISNGLTYPFTFTFERSGAATVSVPISAGDAARRDAPVAVEVIESDTGGQH